MLNQGQLSGNQGEVRGNDFLSNNNTCIFQQVDFFSNTIAVVNEGPAS